MKPILKWAGIVLGILVSLILLINLVMFALGESRLKRVYNSPEEWVTFPTGSEAFNEGKRIFQYRGCEACHGEGLEGLIYLDNPAIGQVITPNLTTGIGGIGAQRTDADLLRSIRHGLRPDGTALLFMPSTEFYYLSDRDLGSVIAYIRSTPPVNNELPPSRLSATGRIVMNITKEITFLPAELIPHTAPRPVAPQPGQTPAYGEYLSHSCKVCHGPALSGGDIPGFPPDWPSAPNLTSGQGSRLPAWGEEGFIQIIRTGQKHGRAINPDYMPWKSYRHMTVGELRAVYIYLQSLPARDFGNR